jgi:type II secretion system protein I
MINPEVGRRKAERGMRIRSASSITSPYPSRVTSHGLNGFTLLEVMVAVSIMAMVLVTLLGLKNRSMQDVMVAEHITTATMLAKREIVKTITTNPLKKWLPDEQEGDFAGEEDFSGYAWKKTISQIPISNDVFITEIRVAILWKEGDRQEMVELVDYE